MQDEPEPDSGAAQEDSSPPELPSSESAWSERKGKGLFWCLLFAPAVLTLIALAVSLSIEADSPVGLVVGGGLGFGICLYCGIWMASGFQLSKTGRIFAGLGLSLAFCCLNALVIFAGCFAVVMALR